MIFILPSNRNFPYPLWPSLIITTINIVDVLSLQFCDHALYYIYTYIYIYVCVCVCMCVSPYLCFMSFINHPVTNDIFYDFITPIIWFPLFQSVVNQIDISSNDSLATYHDSEYHCRISNCNKGLPISMVSFQRSIIKISNPYQLSKTVVAMGIRLCSL